MASVTSLSVLFDSVEQSRFKVETSKLLYRETRKIRVYIYIYRYARDEWMDKREAKGNRDSNRATLLERNLFTNPDERKES